MAAFVAHMLHTPITAIDGAEVGDLLEWFEDALELSRRFGA